MDVHGEIAATRPLLVVAVAAEAEHLDTDLPILVAGVGKLAAAAAVFDVLASRPAAARPTGLVNLGTAGALHDHLEGIFEIGTVVQHDLDGRAIEELTGQNPSPEIVLGEGPILASGDVFVQDAAHRARLATRADLCDMEGYAVAAAGLCLGIPVTLVKHVSDRADESARRSWVTSVSISSKALGCWLEEWTAT
jgi:adenosylhomocysteine nucleosidase